MKILVAASTIPEIELLIETKDAPPYKLIITGIGTAATTYHLTAILKNEKPDLLIQAGIAGAFDSNYGLGEVAIIEQDRFADLGVEEDGKWRDIFDLGLASPDDYPFTSGWLRNPSGFIHQLDFPLLNSITVNEITTSKSRIEVLKKKYQPALESMEGAALHFVCIQEEVPFIQLRSVSNYVGERDKSNWQMQKSIENLNRALIQLIERLHQKEAKLILQ
jgi:futalosine hydrolase